MRARKHLYIDIYIYIYTHIYTYIYISADPFGVIKACETVPSPYPLPLGPKTLFPRGGGVACIFAKTEIKILVLISLSRASKIGAQEEP